MAIAMPSRLKPGEPKENIDRETVALQNQSRHLRYWPKADILASVCPLPEFTSALLRCSECGGGNETSRVHFEPWRGSSVAACGARTAERPRAAHRCTDGFGRGRSGTSESFRGVPTGLATTGVERRPQCAH